MIGRNSTTRPRRWKIVPQWPTMNGVMNRTYRTYRTYQLFDPISPISPISPINDNPRDFRKEETMRKSSAVIVAMFICSALLVPAKGQSGNQAATEPLTLQALNIMLRREVGRDMTEADLAARIERFGIAFDPTSDAVSRLRANGAHQNLINAVKRAADKFSASAGKVVGAGPQTSDPFIEETRKVVRDYIDELPDFICQQEIQRYLDLEGTGAWEKADRLVYELTYNRKHESYKPINGVGRPITRSLDEAGGATSTGDFATALAGIFDLESKTVFKPAGKERLGTRQTILYDFRVPKETSALRVKAEGADPLIVGYSGTVWIDAETKRVLRIDQAVDDLPKSYPIPYAERSVDYDIVKLRGLDVDFLLPIRAEVIIGDRVPKRHSRNLIYFKFYRKFETDVKLGDDITPATPQKPPQ